MQLNKEIKQEISSRECNHVKRRQTGRKDLLLQEKTRCCSDQDQTNMAQNKPDNISGYIPQCSRTALEPQCPKSGQISPGLNPSSRSSGSVTVNNLYPGSSVCEVTSWRINSSTKSPGNNLLIFIRRAGRVLLRLFCYPSSTENVGGAWESVSPLEMWTVSVSVAAVPLLPPPSSDPSDPHGAEQRGHCATRRSAAGTYSLYVHLTCPLIL